MYYILLPSLERRTHLIEHLKSKGIHAVFHYVPLHTSTMGREVCRSVGDLENTTSLSGRLLRLPFWLGMEALQEEIINEVAVGLN
jgi:dTDP-4-amino-4,6-dideoxygalactose transaminase